MRRSACSPRHLCRTHVPTWRGQPTVAGHRQLEAAPKGHTLNGSHRGLGPSLHQLVESLHQRDSLLQDRADALAATKQAYVEACREAACMQQASSPPRQSASLFGLVGNAGAFHKVRSSQPTVCASENNGLDILLLLRLPQVGRQAEQDCTQYTPFSRKYN